METKKSLKNHLQETLNLIENSGELTFTGEELLPEDREAVIKSLESALVLLESEKNKGKVKSQG